MEAAARPYLEMLSKWIHEGSLEDPYEEFMIEETGRGAGGAAIMRDDFNASYWSGRYRVNEKNVCRFVVGSSEELDRLDVHQRRHESGIGNGNGNGNGKKTMAQKILVTGKYLNVILECGETIENDVVDIPFVSTTEEGEGGKRVNYDRIVSDAFEFASEKLLHLMMGPYALLDRLRSIKRYFLLDQGDFFVQFLDVAEEEVSEGDKGCGAERSGAERGGGACGLLAASC